VAIFKKMKEFHNIDLPKGICANVTEDQLDVMTRVALSLEPLWENALGKNWKSEVNADILKDIYRAL
jgi:3-deoxy-alpha-D-manno-octulosonate 8-oxidase